MNGWPAMEEISWHSPDEVLLVSASRSLGNALEKLSRSKSRWIVLVRQHPVTNQTYYYAFRREEFEAFQTDDANLLATPSTIAVDRHEWTSSAVSHNNRPSGEWSGTSGPTAMRIVDFDLDGNIRQIGEYGIAEAAVVGGDRPLENEELLAELGATRGGGRGDEEEPGDDAIRLTMSAEANGELEVGNIEIVTFKIELTSEASPLTHNVDAPARPDVGILVSLSVENDILEVVDAKPQTIPPPTTDSSRTGFFQIRTTRPGVCRFAVRFRQGGADLAVIPMAVEVVDDVAQTRPIRAEANATPSTFEVDEKLTLTVDIRNEGGRAFYEYELYSEPLNFHGRRFRSRPLQDRGNGPAGTIQAYIDRLYEQVARKLRDDVASDLKRLQREVKALGANLSDELFEPDIVRTLWPLREKIRLIQVISWEPYVPWEMVRLRHPDSGEIDNKFLAEYGLIRTLSDSSPPREMPARNWTYHRADFPSGMYPPVGAEIDYFTGAGPGRLCAHGIEPMPLDEGEDAFYDTLAQANFDVLHLACHAEGDEEEIDRARLIIGEVYDSCGAARPITVGPSILQAEAHWAERHPMVFLNACETGRSGGLLTAWGGWPNVFIRCGAGAFVGSAWPVRDGPASRFATAFYESLLGGATLATAATSAREAARVSENGTELDASWLAFKVYGHPSARFVATPNERPNEQR